MAKHTSGKKKWKDRLSGCHGLGPVFVLASFIALALPAVAASLKADAHGDSDLDALQAAKSSLRRGEYNRTLEIVDNILVRAPKNATAHELKANVLMRRRELRAAINEEKIALACGGDRADAILAMANCYSELNELQESLALFDKVISIGGHRPCPAHTGKSYVLLKLGQTEGAKVEALKAEQSPGYDTIMRHALQPLRDQIDHQLALLPRSQLPLSLRSDLESAEMMWIQKRLPEALRNVESALKKSPDNAQAHALKGNIFASQAKHQAAIDEMRKAVAAAPHYQHGYMIISQCQAARDNWQESLKSLDSAIACGGEESGLAHREKSELLCQVGRYQDALSAIDAAIILHRHSPQEITDLRSRINLDRRLADWKSLVRDASHRQSLETSETKTEERIFDLQQRADAFFQMGQWQEAIEDYLAILKITPDCLQALRGLKDSYEKQGAKKEANEIARRLDEIKRVDRERHAQ